MAQLPDKDEVERYIDSKIKELQKNIAGSYSKPIKKYNDMCKLSAYLDMQIYIKGGIAGLGEVIEPDTIIMN